DVAETAAPVNATAFVPAEVEVRVNVSVESGAVIVPLSTFRTDHASGCPTAPSLNVPATLKKGELLGALPTPGSVAFCTLASPLMSAEVNVALLAAKFPEPSRLMIASTVFEDDGAVTQ